MERKAKSQLGRKAQGFESECFGVVLEAVLSQHSCITATRKSEGPKARAATMKRLRKPRLTYGRATKRKSVSAARSSVPKTLRRPKRKTRQSQKWSQHHR